MRVEATNCILATIGRQEDDYKDQNLECITLRVFFLLKKKDEES